MVSTNFNFGFKLLRIAGLWPFDTADPFKNFLYRVYQAVTWIYFLVLYQITQYIDFYFSLDSLEKISLNCRSTLTAAMLLINSTELIRKYKSIRDLKRKLEKDENAKKESCKEIYDKALKEIRFLHKILTGLILPSMTLRFLSPFLDTKSEVKKLPTGQWVPLDLRIRSNFLIAWFNQVVEGYFLASYIMGLMFISAGFLIRITAEYDALIQKIQTLNKIYEEKTGDRQSLEEKNVFRLIKDVIANYQEILNETKQFEKLFNIIFVIQLLSFTLVFVINGLNILIRASKNIRSGLVAEVMYLLSISYFFFVVCFYGTRVFQKSNDVVDAIYGTPWYEMSPKLRKNLLLIIVRAQNPPRLTAGNLYMLTLATYKDMLQATYQFFMLGFSFVAKSVN